MKNNNFSPDDFFPLLSIFILVLMFVGVPVLTVGRIITTQQVINQECKTNYNLIQVALAGDNLSRICQIKNQTVTIK